MNELNRALSSVTYQLHANALIRSVLLAASAYLLVTSFGGSGMVSLLAGLAGLAVGTFLTKPFQNKKPQAIQLIHQSVGDAEYSLPLLDKPQLNIAEQLQLERLGERVQRVRVPGVLLAKAGRYGMGLLVAMAVYVGYPRLRHDAPTTPKKLV